MTSGEKKSPSSRPRFFRFLAYRRRKTQSRFACGTANNDTRTYCPHDHCLGITPGGYRHETVKRTDRGQFCQFSTYGADLSRRVTRACVVMGQGSCIKTSSGKAARKPDAHRLLAASGRHELKGMSAATARVWREPRVSIDEIHDIRWHGLLWAVLPFSSVFSSVLTPRKHYV